MENCRAALVLQCNLKKLHLKLMMRPQNIVLVMTPKLDQSNREIFSHALAVYQKDKDKHQVKRNNLHVTTYDGFLLKKF